MWTCAGVLALVACACAVTRDQFYPNGPGLDQSLPRNNEEFSPELTLKVPIRFYGESYESVFINKFGVLTFRADIPTFLNIEFPLPYPSIAAFYTNIDTTYEGSIFYRETDEPHVLYKAEESVQNNFHEYYDFKPTSVFIATWIDVTYASNGSFNTPKNSFQVAVISNGTESFTELLYPERDIQWFQKETQITNVPDAKAQAGFVSEDGRMYPLRGSGSHQIRNIVSWSNSHEPGKYVFRIGDIPFDGNIAAPDNYNQRDLELEDESKTCTQTGPSVCHTEAKCIDYPAGICCQCKGGFYGNGKSCIKDDGALRVHGKIRGVINNVNLNDVDIQSYVVIGEGRTYTALSLVPPRLGNSLQLLNALGGVVGWLFAKPAGFARNGYQLTGSLFNHTADVWFPATGDRVTINQEFLGHDVFDQITSETDIRGTIPVVQPGTKLAVRDYDEQYTLEERGLIRAESSRTFTNKITGEKIEQRVTQTLRYSACLFAPNFSEESVPLTLKVNKNYLGFEDNIVRYGMTNKIFPLGKEDPCVEGRNTCGPHSTCVAEGDTFTCVCQTGFTNIYQNNTVVCIDIDECEAGTNNCDTNADCYNHAGGYQCRCRTGFTGNGISCKSLYTCRTKNCDPNAQCIEYAGQEATCVCNSGFYGDGELCYPSQGYVPENNEADYNDTFVLPNCDISGCYCPKGYSAFRDDLNNQLCRLNSYVPPTQGFYESTYPTSTPASYHPSESYYHPRQSDRPYVPTTELPRNSPRPSYPYDTNYSPDQNNYPQNTLDQNNNYDQNSEDNYPYLSYNNSQQSTNNQPPKHIADQEPENNYYKPSENNYQPPPKNNYYNSVDKNYQPPQENNYYNPNPDNNYPYDNNTPKSSENSYQQPNDTDNESPLENNYDQTSDNNYEQPSESNYQQPQNNNQEPWASNYQTPETTYYEYTEGNNHRTSDRNYEQSSPTGYQLPTDDPLIKCEEDADCPPNAVCSYLSPDGLGEVEGKHCICPEGYEGDAFECIERTGSNCACGIGAHCVSTRDDNYICVCDLGYQGDGYNCRPNFSCKNNSDCEYNAECRQDPNTNEYICQCFKGYIKDQNDACIPDAQLCNGASCPEHASCLYDAELNLNYCHCDDGYIGDGISQCELADQTCEYANDCGPNAVCTPVGNTYQCLCRDGFNGDGYNCVPDGTCRNNPNMCDLHASCIKRYDIYVCECNSGYNGNGSHCELNHRQAGNFLVASDGASVYRVPFKVSPREFATPINSGISQLAVGIGVDCDAGRIFWGDVVSLAIKTSHYDGSDFSIFLSDGVKSPEGISIDWLSRNIFWTDSKKLTIEVANLDTKARKVLFAGNGISNPRGIAVHPQRGKIFWSDWKRADPKIEWANMDGTQRGVFINRNHVTLPNSLAIDWARDRLCYADAGLFSINCVSIDTGVKETIVSNCSYPFGLAIHGNQFYWTDWKTLKIESIDLDTQVRGQVPIATASRHLYGVAVAPRQCPQMQCACMTRNGGCNSDQLCLPDGNYGRSCVDADRPLTRR